MFTFMLFLDLGFFIWRENKRCTTRSYGTNTG